MFNKTNYILAFVLCGGVCAMAPASTAHPLNCLALTNVQEATPKQETREGEREKKPKKESSENEKAAHEKNASEARPAHPPSHPEEQSRSERSAPSTERQAAQQHAQHPASHAHYQFRQQDRPRLRPHFESQLAHVDRAHRPHVAAGEYLESNYQTYLVPVPQDVVVYLEPPPPGYVFGYYYGYVIVYDPATLFVLDVTDLL